VLNEFAEFGHHLLNRPTNLGMPGEQPYALPYRANYSPRRIAVLGCEKTVKRATSRSAGGVQISRGPAQS
jgi:hypothetical protein